MSPWRCPSCSQAINHKGEKPEPGVRYRCHVCRLALEYHEGIEKLIVRRDDDQPKPRRKRSSRK
ncbi:MAG TPA: hypothetical protein VN628_11130 [Vicinamibacterales bacterium]|nr:hypothetical protein [Vicinamibacterales bacterium]